jgi:hypothetical protein
MANSTFNTAQAKGTRKSYAKLGAVMRLATNGLGVGRLPVRQSHRELGGRREEGSPLAFELVVLLHRGGQDRLERLVGPCLPMRLCVVVVATGFLRCVVQHVVNVGVRA